MGATGLQAALNRGAPLVDVTVEFQEGVDAVAATDRINATFEDFDLKTRPWYDQPRLRVGTATAEALERLFGLRLRRVRLGRCRRDNPHLGPLARRLPLGRGR